MVGVQVGVGDELDILGVDTVALDLGEKSLGKLRRAGVNEQGLRVSNEVVIAVHHAVFRIEIQVFGDFHKRFL